MSSLSTTLSVIQRQLIQYGCSAYLIFGIIGSFLNIILLTRRQYRSVSCCIYFTTVSILVLIILPLGVSPFLHSLNHPDLYATITGFCKIRTYLLQVTMMTYRWCLVAACFHRCALTSDSARLRDFTQLHVAYRVLGMFYALGSTTVAVYHGLYTIVTGNIPPMAMMTVCAVLIRQYERRCKLVFNSPCSHVHREHKYIQQIFPMLLIQVLLYIITQTPWMIWNIYATSTTYITNKSADWTTIERFVAFLSDFILFLLPVLPFYLYALASRAYRDELMRLLYHSLHLNYTEERNMNLVHPFFNKTRPAQANIRADQIFSVAPKKQQ